MNFKFFRDENEYLLRLEPMQVLTLAGPHRHINNEYCFQFDDDEPVAFAYDTNEISIRVDGTSEGIITFSDNSFKSSKPTFSQGSKLPEQLQYQHLVSDLWL